MSDPVLFVDTSVSNVTVTGKLNVTDLTTLTGEVKGGYDTNTTSYFGRAAVGYCGHNDAMSIAHIDSNSNGGYALLQESNGETMLNSASGQSVHIRQGNTDKLVINSSGMADFAYTQKKNIFFHPHAWGYSTTSTSDTTLWSFTYNFPYDGYVILNTNGHWRNTSVHTWFYGKLGIDHQDPADTSSFYDSYTGGAQSSHGGDFHEYEENASYWCDFNWGGTLKVSAGNRVICLRVRISGGHLYVNGTAINMFYIPSKIF